MAGKDDFVSVLEQGDMSSPRYRAQLAKEQGLENVYPETWGLAQLGRAAAQTGGRIAQGLRGMVAPAEGAARTDSLMYALKGPAADTAGIDRALGEAQTRVAARQLTPAQKSEWKNTGVAPSNWGEMRQNASYLGADVGRVTAAPPVAPPTDRQLLTDAVKGVSQQATGRLRNFDAPMAVVNALRPVEPTNSQNMREGVSLRYRYGGQ